VDNDKLNCMIVGVVTFLEAAKAKPSMWVDSRLEPLRDWHGYVSSHPKWTRRNARHCQMTRLVS
jgi:hypothetical protein